MFDTGDVLYSPYMFDIRHALSDTYMREIRHIVYATYIYDIGHALFSLISLISDTNSILDFTYIFDIRDV